MGLFGPSKIKITPNDFVKSQLDKIFSVDFKEEEKRNFIDLSKEIVILQGVNFGKYLKERQNVVYNLFQLAWDRTIPHDIFIEYCSIMLDDQRVKAVNSGGYDRVLSRAEESGMHTFGFISKLFIAQIILPGLAIKDDDYFKLYEKYGTDFTSLYIFYEELIKQHKFIR